MNGAAGAGEGAAAAEGALDVDVVYATPDGETIVRVSLPEGSVVGDALAASGILDRHALDPRGLAYAIHGERVPLALPLRTGDRVEITRPLLADAKDARRRRAAERPLPRAKPRPGKPGGRAA